MNNFKWTFLFVLVCCVIFAFHLLNPNRMKYAFRFFKFNATIDVLVYIHIQKTAGKLFDHHLIHYLDVKQPTCKCNSRNKHCGCKSTEGHIWLFSRLTSNWICGVHPSWTQLHECIPGALDRMEKSYKYVKVQRRYRYITILRDPINRYINEWLHIRRGADWQQSQKCNHRYATAKEVIPCYNGLTWINVTLQDFIACRSNLANNRQTRMLADLRRVNCFNSSGMSPEVRDAIMLSSAIENLKNMTFFGLFEYYAESMGLFEKTFNVTFKKKIVMTAKSRKVLKGIDNDTIDKIKKLNQLDIQLYNYAQREFLNRLAG